MRFEPEQRGPHHGPGADGDGAAQQGTVAAIPQPCPPGRREQEEGGHDGGRGQERAGRGRGPRPAALDIAEEANELLEEANANTQAMIDTINAIIRAETIDDIVRATLDTIRKEFGWAYASYWTVDPAENVLVFSLESGRVDDEFQRLTRTARFREGEGLNGRSWRLRDLVHVADLGELHDCCRAPLARRAGIKTAIALPVMRDGQVVGTLDFFSTRPWRSPGAARRPADDRPARLRQVLQAGQPGRSEPDQADGRERAGQHDVRRPRPEGPVHEPEGEQTLKRLEEYLPIKVDQMIGHSIDIFHKTPEHQRRILADPRNLPHTATINVGPELFELSVSAMLDQNGKYIGPMITWEVVTEKIETQEREAETAADIRAVNQLLLAPGAARTVRDVITAALATRARGVRLVVRVVLGGQPRGPGAAVRPRLGLGRARNSAA